MAGPHANGSRPATPCSECGLVHERCKAHRRDGQPCTHWPMEGQAVCKMHGGKSPQALDAAQRRLAEEAARAAVVTYGLPREVDPSEALLEEVFRTAGHVAWIGDQVRLLSPDLVATNSLVSLYHVERRLLVQVCDTAVRAGIEERRVRLEERRAALMADVIRKVLDDPELALDARQREAGRGVAARHLRVLTA